MLETASNITALESPTADPTPDSPPRKQTKVQASEIQSFLHSHIMRLKAKLDEGNKLGEDARDECNALAAVVRAWDVAADRARIARGKPLPGSERPAARKPVRRSTAAGNPTTPTEAPQPVVSSVPPTDPISP